MGMVKNLPSVNQGLDLWVKRVRFTYTEDFRKTVWALFSRILVKTPQSTGRAVAHWSIGIDAPAPYFNPEAGDKGTTEVVGRYEGGSFSGPPRSRTEPRHKQGSRKWIEHARKRNEPKLALIKAESRVFITNSALGDDDGGRSSEFYVESFQDPSYWVKKLREVNQPYETVEESVLFMAEQLGRLRGQSFDAGTRNSDRYS